ncbi:hypothetical protein [Natronospira bacteriovora]|uniref:Uncharacterized protein n=1 Tax=Natronospira bacteriovora TaxID=3069753 RepID=A0ABU0W7X1_9GAMM|nr:hypothetical protein [Natronospira sp. AB-CW4]MDQ2070136.1 hypothetical protein [Natronospira sp. AB-CW4]
MKLLEAVRAFLKWLGDVLGVFIKARPATTLTLIGAHGLARVCSILAFFIPLKVILLAGSPGVPRYFRFFVDPDLRMEWIIGLSIAAVVFYLMTHVLEVAVKRLSEKGSIDILQEANEIAVVSRHIDAARDYYSRFGGVASNLSFSLLFLALISVLIPGVAAAVVALLTLQFGFTAAVLRFLDSSRPRGLSGYIVNFSKNYLTILSAMVFFLGFAVILYPYLVGDGPNILLSLLSFLLLRQALTSLQSAVSDSISLHEERLTVNALVFRDQQLEKQEAKLSRSLRELFDKSQRQDRVSHELQRIEPELHEPDVQWEDSSIPRVNTFRILVEDVPGEFPGQLQMQVFPEKESHKLENEDFLFKHVPREALNSPPVLSRFEMPPFQAQICDYGNGEPLKQKDFRSANLKLREAIWSVSPPQALSEAFRTSKRLLHQRLNDDYVQRISVAVDTSEDEQIYKTLIADLDVIRTLLSKLPMQIFNPDLKPGAVVQRSDGGHYVMSWTKWSLEPVGVPVPRTAKRADIEGLIERMRGRRSDIPDWFTADHIHLANDSSIMEKMIGQGKYRAAMAAAARIIKNPCLKDVS